MGQMRFRVPNASSFDPQIWSTAFVSGLEGIPWASRNRIEDDILIIDRSVGESGKLSIVWPTDEYGPIVLSTASIRCNDAPYLLSLELARGTIHRVRGRALDWQRVGLKLPEAFLSLIDQSLSAFIDAALRVESDKEAHKIAQRSIDLAISASKPLSRAFISQSLQARHQVEKQFSTLLGVKITPKEDWEPTANALLPIVNTLNISMELGQIESTSKSVALSVLDAQMEWARKHSLRVFGGPLMNLQSHAVPKWFYLFNDFDSLYRAACDHANEMVERYRGQVHLWSAAAGLNAPNPLGISDEQILHLAVGVIQTVRRIDPKTPVILNIDTPWAEYLGQKTDGISPLHFADALIRADLGLSGLGLELNMNYWPTGSLPRDLVDLSDLIDHWNILGLPLLAIVTTANSLQPDPGAIAKTNIVSNWTYPQFDSWAGSGPSEADQDSSDSDPSKVTNATAVRLPANGMEIVQMLLAKNNIHGIMWNQASDLGEHGFPNAGLVSSTGKHRSLLDGLVRLRQLHVH